MTCKPADSNGRPCNRTPAGACSEMLDCLMPGILVEES